MRNRCVPFFFWLSPGFAAVFIQSKFIVQGIQGFPTVKVFPRGKYLPPMLLEQERTASSLYNFAARRVPKVVDALKKLKDVTDWVEKVCRFIEFELNDILLK